MTENRTPAVGREQVHRWQQEFAAFRAGKRRLEQRIIDAEQVWKLRHWEQIRNKDTGDPEPASGWLVNVILSKHSDACAAYPRPICLPREEGDRAEADMLSDILPVVLQQNEFDRVWSDIWWYKLKGGTAVYGVFWDPQRHDGLGDIAIRKVDLLNLFWEPGIADIQDSRTVYHASLMDTDELCRQYPSLSGRVPGGAGNLSRYVYEDTVDTSDKTLVLDVYYKRRQSGRTVLHYARIAGDELLYATENETEPVTALIPGPDSSPIVTVLRPPYAETGLYAHGQYPFVFDALFPEEGYPNCGFGYVDLCKDPQKYIDLMDNALMKNMLANVTPRWFIRTDGAVNEKEYADMTRPFVHMTGRLDSDSIRPIEPNTLDSVYVSLKQLKIDELKQVSGNRDVNSGGTGSGITSGTAIAALQEAGRGISQDMIAASYRAFRRVVELCIELIREFYDTPRQFRIRGDKVPLFVTYNNSGLRPRSRGSLLGVDLGLRLPVFDIEVEMEKAGTYTTAMYNELAVQLYKLGAFRPELADQSLLLLDMMDFKGKRALQSKIAAAGDRWRLQQALAELPAGGPETGAKGADVPVRTPGSLSGQPDRAAAAAGEELNL